MRRSLIGGSYSRIYAAQGNHRAGSRQGALLETRTQPTSSGARQMVERNSTLRLIKAPHELRPFYFLMVWHPRITTDARHTWLREAMRQAASALPPPLSPPP